MIEIDFLKQLARFNLVIHKKVTSKYVGPRRSLSAGRGMTFKDHRMYSPGDDFRHIDWKVFARTDDLYIKNFEEEKNLTAHIIIDSSASMNFGKPHTKFEYASMLGVGFAYLALKENERFMFSTFSDTLTTFQPKRDMSHLGSMVDHLNEIELKGMSNIADAMLKYKKSIGSRALIFILSDFLVDKEHIENALFNFKGQEVKVIQVLDKVEMNLDLQGDYIFKDAEAPSTLRTFVTPRLRMNYHTRMEDHSAYIRQTSHKLGYSYYRVSSATPIFDAFYHILA